MPLLKVFSIHLKDTVMVAQCVVCNSTDCVCALTSGTIKVVICSDANMSKMHLPNLNPVALFR